MNDQPKPTTGEQLPKPYALGECDSVIDKRPFSRSLKSKTGEWTDEYVSNVFQAHPYPEEAIRTIRQLHNAALAAEENKRADWNVVIEDLEAELSKYKEAAITECKRKESWFKENQQLREQLAAEREQHKLVCDVVEEKLVRMKKQLAAERERADKAAARAELAQIQLAEVKEVL